jgi:gamma-glutamyl:cysteine ligase YbdK (ATP-grasp superfamily)
MGHWTVKSGSLDEANLIKSVVYNPDELAAAVKEVKERLETADRHVKYTAEYAASYGSQLNDALRAQRNLRAELCRLGSAIDMEYQP